MADKDLMDSETRGEPATVDQGREPPAGSRGETGQKEGVDLSPAVPIEAEKQMGINWECMSCGSVYDDPVKKCPSCGGHVRKTGLQAKPVFEENLNKPGNAAAPPQASTETPAGTGDLTPGAPGERESATIEDLSARGERDSAIPKPEDPDQKERTSHGGDHSLGAERVHKSDQGSPGGGGGVGAS